MFKIILEKKYGSFHDLSLFHIIFKGCGFGLGLLSALTPKGPRPFLAHFLKFGQAIAIFVPKISNFQ